VKLGAVRAGSTDSGNHPCLTQSSAQKTGTYQMIQFTKIAILMVLGLTLAPTDLRAQSMSSEQFNIISNILVNGVISNQVWPGSIQMNTWGWSNFRLDQAPQTELNRMALTNAEKLSDSNEQTSYAAAENLRRLCYDGMVTDPAVIPHLIHRLPLRAGPLNDSISVNCTKSLAMMTRRMVGAICSGPDLGFYEEAGATNRTRLVEWWKNWWEANKSKHPVYCNEVDQRVRAAYTNTMGIIESGLKPKFRELALFSSKDSYLGPSSRVEPAFCLSQLYEYQYEPYRNSMWSGGNSIWLEVACRFQDPELPTKWGEYHNRDGQPPKSLSPLVTVVASNNVPDTEIYVEVKVACTNQQLVTALREALAPKNQ